MEEWRQIDFLVTRKRHKEALEMWKSFSEDFKENENYYLSKIIVSRALVALGRRDEAFEYVTAGLNFLDDDQPFPYIHYKAYGILGIIAHIDKRYDDALISFQKAYNAVALNPKLEREKANALNDIGSIQMLLKDYDGAEGNISKAIELLEFMGDFKSAARSFGNLAMICQHLNEHEKSLACVERGLSILNHKNHEELVSELIMIRILSLLETNHLDKAKENFYFPFLCWQAHADKEFYFSQL